MDKTLPAEPGSHSPVEPVPDRRTEIRDRLRGRSVVLVGLMGAGKTTIGRRLSAQLGLPFRDADHEIEAAAGMPIPDIFASYGEAAFRDGEKRVIARLLEGDSLVVATGGGAFMNDDTRDRIRLRGISVWLKADHETLMRRVRRKSNRPLLRTGDPDGTMRRLMTERYPVYGLADLVVPSTDNSHERVTQDVMDALHGHLSPDGPFPDA